jgi:hypothetical protein
MPTVLRIFGLRVVIYPNDHRPPHVHVMGNGHEAVFELRCFAKKVSTRENYGFPSQELVRIAVELRQHLKALCGAWEVFHGLV